MDFQPGRQTMIGGNFSSQGAPPPNASISPSEMHRTDIAISKISSRSTVIHSNSQQRPFHDRFDVRQDTGDSLVMSAFSTLDPSRSASASSDSKRPAGAFKSSASLMPSLFGPITQVKTGSSAPLIGSITQERRGFIEHSEGARLLYGKIVTSTKIRKDATGIHITAHGLTPKQYNQERSGSSQDLIELGLREGLPLTFNGRAACYQEGRVYLLARK
ncbi:MAG: hypothetical protein K0S07_788 [Chlamydiales bacterium]|jgi:hypothetical protein|nr:hypothetical protein [Chlamydiales bacterium]